MSPLPSMPLQPPDMSAVSGSNGSGIAEGRQALQWSLTALKGQIAVVSSFGADSAVLLALVADIDPSTTVLFLDTGMHLPETIAYRHSLTDFLGLRDVRDVRPAALAVNRRDPDGIRHAYDPDACCALRKVEPLEQALGPFTAWVTGRKRYQATTRATLPVFEIVDGRTKINPLAYWDAERIKAEMAHRDLPRHPLVAQGFPSISCAPCTRSILPDADPRSGRWATSRKTECGIHRPAASLAQPNVRQLNANPSRSDQASVSQASAKQADANQADAKQADASQADASQPRVRKTMMTDLDQLEAQSIFVLREAYHRLRPLGLLWSLGKDSNVLIWLARKAFLGRVPMPVYHVDTGRKFPEMYAFRDRYAAAWGLDLHIGTCPPVETVDPTLPPAARSAARKTGGLAALIERDRLAGVVAGIRRDEQATRAKERVFSPRGIGHRWDVRNQPPEFWDQFATPAETGSHVRVHPLLAWRELDIWRYIQRESIPVVGLYFARQGQRYRSLGDQDITFPVASQARTVAEILAELRVTHQAERAGRAMDNETEDAFERLRVGGYL